jgi:hypothetical protein
MKSHSYVATQPLSPSFALLPMCEVANMPNCLKSDLIIDALNLTRIIPFVCSLFDVCVHICYKYLVYYLFYLGGSITFLEA